MPTYCTQLVHGTYVVHCPAGMKEARDLFAPNTVHLAIEIMAYPCVVTFFQLPTGSIMCELVDWDLFMSRVTNAKNKTKTYGRRRSPVVAVGNYVNPRAPKHY